MFLTKEEIRELTGYAYASKQIEWLRNYHWKFEVNAQRIPKVSRSYFESRLGGSSSRQNEELVVLPIRPKFELLNQPRVR
ncbi:DUF4224 domain-containing protein [Undibacterium sp. Xuan67W]|uniref:DUF4224 domain-containing protein n=1 Tax=Undibacterium sp. Xuan67W TaxID=3413057 RepID=UPI003BF04058